MIANRIFNYRVGVENFIFVVNVREALEQNSRESMEAAAKRWDVALMECNEYDSILHPACWKTMAFNIIGLSRGKAPERILILDADMVVSSECPNPFEVFTKDQFAVVTDRQTHNPARDKAEIDEWEIITGIRAASPYYFNSGFILASFKHHGEFFQGACKLCHDHPHLCWHDQTPFNVALVRNLQHINVCRAAERFNFHNPAGRLGNWSSLGWRDLRRSGQYIYHFPGNPDRKSQINSVIWK